MEVVYTHCCGLDIYQKTVVQERARTINRLQKVLEDANIKLASVVTDIRGVSARAMREAFMAGERDVQVLAELARGRMRSQRAALEDALCGHFPPPHSCMLPEHLRHIDYLAEAIARVSATVEQYLATDQQASARLDTIPGVGQHTAERLMADIGTDMCRVPRAKPLASWAGRCPGHDESGGQRLSGKTRKGSRWLRQAVVEVAQVSSKTKGTDLSALYRRLAARRGKQRARRAGPYGAGHRVSPPPATAPLSGPGGRIL